jgi:hypothetical protein
MKIKKLSAKDIFDMTDAEVQGVLQKLVASGKILRDTDTIKTIQVEDLEVDRHVLDAIDERLIQREKSDIDRLQKALDNQFLLTGIRARNYALRNRFSEARDVIQEQITRYQPVAKNTGISLQILFDEYAVIQDQAKKYGFEAEVPSLEQ